MPELRRNRNGYAEAPQPSGADNLNTIALALASYESAERGGDRHGRRRETARAGRR
jgi:hypothetical protein